MLARPRYASHRIDTPRFPRCSRSSLFSLLDRAWQRDRQMGGMASGSGPEYDTWQHVPGLRGNKFPTA